MRQDRVECSDESQQCDASAQSSSECNAHTIVPYPSCICSDVPVQVSDPSAPLFTCAQEYNNGNCGQSFLKDTVDTIPEGESPSFCPKHYLSWLFECLTHDSYNCQGICISLLFKLQQLQRVTQLRSSSSVIATCLSLAVTVMLLPRAANSI